MKKLYRGALTVIGFGMLIPIGLQFIIGQAAFAQTRVDVAPGDSLQITREPLINFAPVTGVTASIEGSDSAYVTVRLDSFEPIFGTLNIRTKFTLKVEPNAPIGELSITVLLDYDGAGVVNLVIAEDFTIVTGTPTELAADFVGAPLRGLAPLVVQFTDQSLGSVENWLWEFGDGQTSQEQNPTHTYSEVGNYGAGDYTVRLTVNGPNGSSTRMLTNYVIVDYPWYLGESGADGFPEAIYFVDERIGWIVGGRGMGEPRGEVILKTIDGGNTWISQSSGLSGGLNSIHVIDAKKAWAAGDDGKLIKTVDGGETWELQNTGTNEELNSIFFINENTGWIAGRNEAMLKTIDAGMNWQLQPFSSGGIAEHLKYVQFVDANVGWAIGDTGGEATIYVYKSIDGGTTWQALQLSKTGPLKIGILGTAYFHDVRIGWVAGIVRYWENNQNIYKAEIFGTTDGGATWIIQESIPNKLNFIRSAHFIDETTGWMVGYDGLIMNTTNGGMNWNKEEAGITETLSSIHFINPATGWVVGIDGHILRKTTTPIADFTGDPTSGIAPLTVAFTNRSSRTITDYSWDFGDGSSSNEINPSHTYNSPGEYTVSLEVMGPTGSDTKIAVAYISTNILGTQKWAFTTRDYGYGSSSPAIGADGTIYIQQDDVYALDPNGTQKWRFHTSSSAVSPAIGTDGTIYVGSDKLYALNPDGTPKWAFAFGSYVVSSPALGADGTIYFGAINHKLYALNPNGTEKWAFTTGDWVTSSPAIGADGTIYVGSNDNKLYALNPNGTQKWALTIGSYGGSSPAIGVDGTIYHLGPRNAKLYAINPNGTQKWAFTIADNDGGVVESSPAIGIDGTIYVGSWDNKLYAINSDGTSKWAFTTGDEVDSSPAIGADGTIYVGSMDSKLYAINPDGTQKWAFTTEDRVEYSPAISVDGTVYVGSVHKLYAISSTSKGLAQSAWPKFRANTQNTGRFSSTGTSVQRESDNMPDEFTLLPNYPNPFNPETTIRFYLPKTSNVVLSIYDVLGIKVCTLAIQKYAAGWQQVKWTGTNESGHQVGSGIYFLKFTAGEFSTWNKMSLLR
ncbi:PKD domain-containing protein [candidate division KSB1 bacterium]|nr:PKD domain-containing protein [candidate division KSB1 bacterium]MCE7940788.1 PKD domain-containing protein [Chlorobi bacterium CHB1]